jgi:ornithine cyclodeaminase/alanine dehydrogenase
VLILGRADLERVLPPADAIAALEVAFRQSAEGKARTPARMALPAGDDGVLLAMPGVLEQSVGDVALGAKLVSVYAGNPARGHPTVYASYVLMDGATGQPLALLEGTYLTALRTGATSALAARLLSRPDARRVVCFGAGVQARFQLACLAAVRTIERVDAIGRDAGRASAFAAEMEGRLGVPVRVAADARQAVRAAELVTCATTSPTPVVFGGDVAPGTHVDLVGAFRATDREADTELMRRARVVVDTYEGAFAEAGDVLIPVGEGAFERSHVAAQLAEVVTGARPGRTTADQVTVFKSVGWAIEDLATARLAYNRARADGVGTEVTL